MKELSYFTKESGKRRYIQYGLMLNDEEMDNLEYLSENLGLSKADTIRYAVSCLKERCEKNE